MSRGRVARGPVPTGPPKTTARAKDPVNRTIQTKKWTEPYLDCHGRSVDIDTGLFGDDLNTVAALLESHVPQLRHSGEIEAPQGGRNDAA
jgi:hypothetical protein